MTISSAMINQLLQDYKDFVSVATPTSIDYQNATRSLSVVFNAVAAYPTGSNLDAVWDFFVANQNEVVQENIALYGVGILTPNDRAIYNLLYTLFRQATNGSQPTLAGEAGSIALSVPNLFAYLRQKALTVTPGLENPPGGAPTVVQVIETADTTRGLKIEDGGTLTFDDAAFTAYILRLLAAFMNTAPTSPSGLGDSVPWSDGGTLAFTPPE